MPQAQTAELNLNEILRQVAREKDIDLERWIAALEDAMASAAKKQHRIKEPVRAHLDRETGKFDAFIVKKVVETVEDPLAEWTVEEARDHKAERRDRRRDPPADLHRRPRPHRRAERQAGALPAGARGRAREHLQRIHRPRGRDPERHRQALRARRHDRRPRPHRGDHPALRAVAPRALQPGRAHPRRHRRRPQAAQGAADRALAHRSAPAGQALRDRSAGDLRRHGGDQERRPRARRARQDGGLQPRARRRSGRRLRRHEGIARAVDHPRAARREDRHHRVQRRPGDLRPERAGAGQDHPRLGDPPGARCRTST